MTSDRRDLLGRLDGRELTEARVRRISERTAMVEATPAGSANVGIVVGDRRVLVIDTRVAPAFARELAATITESLAVTPAELVVVNTHFHGDHVFGNGAFLGATFVAGRLTQLAMAEQWAAQVEIFTGLRPAQADDIRSAVKVVPDIGVDGIGHIDLGGVVAVLEPTGPAHTPGDSLVRVPDEGVVFCADLVFNGHWPATWDADFAGWLAALRRLAPTRDTVVPGHGAAGDAGIVARMAEAMRFLIELELDQVVDRDAAIEGSPYAGYLHRGRVEEALPRIREQRAAIREALA